MKQLKILLAFDYELSLGGARDYDRNLFEPADALIDLATDIEVPITMFADVCCLMKYRDWDPAFADRFSGQLQRSISEGHDVQLHLHPHWLDSQYENGSFVPAKTYTLGCFKDREPPLDLPGIIRSGIDVLTQLCGEVDPQYRCLAYRAGGYHLAPETAAILHGLIDAGIVIESSIAKNNVFRSELWEVDHRNMPREANWYLDPDRPVNEASRSGLFEIPIASRPRTAANNLPFLFKRVMHRLRRYDSQGWSIDVGNTSLVDKVGRMFPDSAWLLGFDNFTDSVADLMRILRYHVSRHSADEQIVCSTVSHPKCMGEYARRLMRDFVAAVHEEYGDQVSFCTYQSFAKSGLPSLAGSVSA